MLRKNSAAERGCSCLEKILLLNAALAAVLLFVYIIYAHINVLLKLDFEENMMSSNSKEGKLRSGLKKLVMKSGIEHGCLLPVVASKLTYLLFN